MPISEDTIRRIRESTDIVEVVSEYVSLQKRGSANYFGLCPFHEEKSPSFSVHSTRQTFHCFGCGEGGNVYTFLMKIEGIEFPDAVRRLGQRTGIAVDEDRDGKQSSEMEATYRAAEIAAKYFRYRLTDQQGEDITFARDYLKNRGISEELQEKFMIGLAPPEWDSLIGVAGRREIPPRILEKAGLARKNDRGGYYDWFRGRLMFPIFNAGGRVVAFGGRILRDEGGDRPQPKYINSPDTPIFQKGKLLYGLPQARDAMRQQGKAIIVEGYTDLIALHSGGFTNAVAGLGTALTHEQASLILRFAKSAMMLYDADAAGDMAAFRGADVLVGAGLEVNVALMPPGEDPDTLIRNQGPEAVQKVLDSSKPLIDFKLDHFRRLGRLNTPQGRTEAARSLLETLGRIRDPITRQFALHETAEKLGVDERTLAGELDRDKTTTVRREATSDGAPKDRREPLRGFEVMLQNLLWVLLTHPERRSEVFNYFHTADIGDHSLRPVFEWIESAHIEGQPTEEADLYDALGRYPQLVKRVGEILNRPDPGSPEFLETIVRDAPTVLRRAGIKEEMRVLQEAIKSGTAPDGMARYQELKQELRKLDEQDMEE